MLYIEAKFFIKDDQREFFLNDILPLMETARQEEGCLDYHLYESFEEPNQFVMTEKWANQEAIDNHNKQHLLLNLFGHMKEYAKKPTVVNVFSKEE